MCIAAFIEGILFAFFCFELLQEQFEAIEINQTYIDDMKELFGKPLDFITNLKCALGYDIWWWLLPTQPCIPMNYLEKMYTVKEIKKLRDFEEDDYDQDHKIFAKTILKSRREKKIFGGIVLILVTLWVLWARYKMVAWLKGEQVEWLPSFLITSF
jgi:hypothetical protein